MRTEIESPAEATRLKLMVVDEAWRYLRDPVVLGRLTEAARTWRKRNAALILATQSVTDITETAGAAALLESMPTRLFLANHGLHVQMCSDSRRPPEPSRRCGVHRGMILSGIRIST